ncbi:hypothetical protein H8356DRAFT_151331 [Neocallimastix lanati (nom. inval.)]|nr:hypothetical protein H8356DRAFT_151331 [Neocallimastix sp. JGI-2020a]
MNANNETLYFDTIEEYSKYIGPAWFGVSYCDNSTVVNNVGRYFTYVGDDKNKKPSNDYETKLLYKTLIYNVFFFFFFFFFFFILKLARGEDNWASSLSHKRIRFSLDPLSYLFSFNSDLSPQV